jgi:hypothetical protein
MLCANQSLARYAQSSVSEDFYRLHCQTWRRQVWATLTGQRHDLLSLHKITRQTKVQTRSHAGIKLVPIAQICGSEGRCDDFDADFRPLKGHNRDRWVSVALARSRDVALPPVELVQVNDVYFVRDGHHRISVAKLAGQQEIEAEVTVWHGVAVATDTQAQTPAASQTPQPTVKERFLSHIGRWLVNVGVQLQARGRVAVRAPALQSN